MGLESKLSGCGLWVLGLLGLGLGVLGKAPERFSNNSGVGPFSILGDNLTVTADRDLLTSYRPASTCASLSESE